MEFITIDVAKRENLGTAESNRLRREDVVPAVLYGMQRPNIELSIDRHEIERFLRTGSHLVELKLGGKARPAILREMQTDAVTDRILHLDFVRVDDQQEIETEVPLNWKGRAKGEGEGGVFTAVMNSVNVKAKPRALPRQYTIDINDLGLDETISLADIEQREGVTFVDPLDTVVATCAEPKIVIDEDEAAEGVEGETPADADAAAESGEGDGADTPASE